MNACKCLLFPANFKLDKVNEGFDVPVSCHIFVTAQDSVKMVVDKSVDVKRGRVRHDPETCRPAPDRGR